MAHHKEARENERERRALVSTLVRSFGLPSAVPEIGNIIAVLTKAGIFRVRGVLVRTAAYQTYSAMLGTKPFTFHKFVMWILVKFQNMSIAIKNRVPRNYRCAWKGRQNIFAKPRDRALALFSAH
jgi:hypothetical protein